MDLLPFFLAGAFAGYVLATILINLRRGRWAAPDWRRK